MKKAVAIVTAACLLSGCAEIAVPNPDEKYKLTTEPEPSTTTVAAVADYASNYARFTRDTARELKYDDATFDGAILVAAMAAAGALAFPFSDSVRARAVAGAGLFAGGITAWRTRLSPKDAAGVYERTARRMTCISNTLLPLQSAITLPVQGGLHKALVDGLGDLQTQEQKVQAALAKATDADVKKKGDDALKAADAEAIIAAHLLDAVNNGSRYGLSEIILAETDLSSGLDGKTLDYGALRDSLVASTKDKVQSDANANTAGNTPGAQTITAPRALKNGKAPKLTPDDDAKIATNNLLTSIGNTKSLTDRAAPAQDVKADLVTCRTTGS